MKLLKKDEKRNAQRPKLSDTNKKKKSLIICIVCVLISFALILLVGYKLKIIPSKLKGTVTCTSIPDYLQPNSVNPNGLHEYGFTDLNFYNVVINAISATDDYCTTVTLEQLSNVKSISAYKKNITNLNGVEYLSGLTSLSVTSNNISSVDLTNNINLTMIDLDSNNINYLNVTGLQKLVRLDFSYNNVKNIDLSTNNLIETLNASVNPELTTIDLSNNAKLYSLNLSNNNITTINLDNNVELEYLYLYDNKISYIDLSKLNNLLELYLDGNEISQLDVSQLINLEGLYISRTKIKNLDLSSNVNLSTLNINYTPIENFDLRNCNKLGTIKATFNDEYFIKKGDSRNIEFKFTTSYSNETTYNCYYNMTCQDNKIYAQRTGVGYIEMKYKINDYYTYKYTNTIYMYDMSSTKYDIDFNNKVIDVKGDVLDVSVLASNIELDGGSGTGTTGFYFKLEGDDIVLKPSNDRFKVINYSKYRLKWGDALYYDDGKDINLGQTLIDTVIKEFELKPSNYTKKLDDDILIIYNENNEEVGRHKVTNYILWEVRGYGYVVDNENKTIDVRGAFFSKDNLYIRIPTDYTTDVIGNKLVLINPKGKQVDYYTLINYKEIDEDAYIKAGFNDKNLYSCVLKSYDRSNDYSYLLTDNELANIDRLSCPNKGIEDVKGIEKLTNLNILDLHNNNISTINPYIDNLNVTILSLSDNNISVLDLHNNTNLSSIILDNNPITDAIYMIKGENRNYHEELVLNEKYYNMNYSIEGDVLVYDSGKLRALDVGNAIIKSSNPSIQGVNAYYYNNYMDCVINGTSDACSIMQTITSYDQLMQDYIYKNEIKIYDIQSEEYFVDKDHKIIDLYEKDLNEENITLISDELTGELTDDYYIVKDGDKVVHKYALINKKQEKPDVTPDEGDDGHDVKPDDGNDTKPDDHQEDIPKDNDNNKQNDKDKKTTSSSKKTTTKNKTVTTTKKKEKDNTIDNNIYINGPKVPLATLYSVKNQDRNIVVSNDKVKITINGRDIEKIDGELDLSYKLSKLNNELKDIFTDGLLLEFINKNISYKVLIELNIEDKLMSEFSKDKINIYDIGNNKEIIAKEIKLDNNIKFHANTISDYVLSSNLKNEKSYDKNKNLIDKNTEINKNNIHVYFVIPIIIFILLIIFILFKRKKKN